MAQGDRPPPEPPPPLQPKAQLPLSGGPGIAPEGFDWEIMVNPKLKEINPEQYPRILTGLRARSAAFGWDYKSLGRFKGEPFRVGLDEAATSVFQRNRPFTHVFYLFKTRSQNSTNSEIRI